MKILLILLFAPLIALALLYFVFPGRLVALGRMLLRQRGRMVQKSVAVDGRNWPYLEGGDPAKPLLLLVHGFAGDKDNWSMIAPYLTRDYHIIAPDLPGFGENERNPDLAYDLQAQTARLKAFADTLGLQRLVIQVQPENRASLRVAIKLGAVCEGIARNGIIVDGEPREAIVHSLIPADFDAR